MSRVFIPDISILTKEEWRERRKAGIGGSDVGIILGMSKYMSAFELFYNKIGSFVEKKETEESEITKEIGTRLEDLVADIFQRKYPSIQVVEDNTMYQHDKYPFMLANFDRRLILPDGRAAILECKTVTNSSEWESTDFCQGINGKCPLTYEYQVRHYMSVADVDLAIVVGLDLLTKKCFFVYVFRDLKVEQMMIAAEKRFWDLVEARKLPTYDQLFQNLSKDAREDAFKRFYGANHAVNYYVQQKDEIDILNKINDLITIQQFYSSEMQKAKEEKEELAVQLFMLCESRSGAKPDRVELSRSNGEISVNQYISISSGTSVNFNSAEFIKEYNQVFDNSLAEDIDETTAILLCQRDMPDRLGKFITIQNKSGKFYFSKRKTRVEKPKKKKIVED